VWDDGVNVYLEETEEEVPIRVASPVWTLWSWVRITVEPCNFLLILIVRGGVHFWPIVPATDGRWGWLWSNWWNEDWQGKPKYLEKTRPSAKVSTTNPTWPDPGSNTGRCGGKPATNRLSYAAARRNMYISFRFFCVCVVLCRQRPCDSSDHSHKESCQLSTTGMSNSTCTEGHLSTINNSPGQHFKFSIYKKRDYTRTFVRNSKTLN
jgi:hypothetical protein